MSKWAVTFLLLSLVSGIIGFAGLVVTLAPVARLAFNLFLFLFLVSVFVRNVWQAGAFQAWREDKE